MALAGVGLLAAATPLLAAVDPFYSSRLQEGIAAAERGAHADAARSLRIACFGMLDEEPQLADCLVRLALAQAASGDQEAFSQTFHRLVEGEELVGLYSKTGLPAELTGRFEAKVVEWIPRAALGHRGRLPAARRRSAREPTGGAVAAGPPRSARQAREGRAEGSALAAARRSAGEGAERAQGGACRRRADARA